MIERFVCRVLWAIGQLLDVIVLLACVNAAGALFLANSWQGAFEAVLSACGWAFIYQQYTIQVPKAAKAFVTDHMVRLWVYLGVNGLLLFGSLLMVGDVPVQIDGLYTIIPVAVAVVTFVLFIQVALSIQALKMCRARQQPAAI